jgi:hypothetical protein
MRRDLVIALLLLGSPAAAAEREYGIAAGLGSLLAPTGPFTGSLFLSAAAMQSNSGRRLIRARGELQVHVGDGVWAVLPTISGDAGLHWGRLDLYFTGGAELLGGARRAGYTSFASMGFLGGGGLSVRLSQRVRLGLRAVVTWLPSFSAVKLAAPDGAEQPNYLYATGLLSLEILGGEVPGGEMEFDPL